MVLFIAQGASAKTFTIGGKSFLYLIPGGYAEISKGGSQTGDALINFFEEVMNANKSVLISTMVAAESQKEINAGEPISEYCIMYHFNALIEFDLSAEDFSLLKKGIFPEFSSKSDGASSKLADNMPRYANKDVDIRMAVSPRELESTDSEYSIFTVNNLFVDSGHAREAVAVARFVRRNGKIILTACYKGIKSGDDIDTLVADLSRIARSLNITAEQPAVEKKAGGSATEGVKSVMPIALLISLGSGLVMMLVIAVVTFLLKRANKL